MILGQAELSAEAGSQALRGLGGWRASASWADAWLIPNEEAEEVGAIFSAYLEPFADCRPLRHRVLNVLQALPEAVQRDFLDDPRFRVTMESFEPGKGWTLWMESPGPNGNGSRCVVLRRRLADASEAFAKYVIAHEFAHAYLRNGGWGEITDVEDAADALAASWGFARPGGSPF